MSRSDRFESASGLRPASAFVLVGAVLALVATKAAKISLWDEGEQPRNLTRQPAPDVTFTLEDAHGIPMALSNERLELVMSPNACWQAHTPAHMARLLSRSLGAAFPPERLLEIMLPDARQGVIRVQSEPLLLNEQQARAVYRWIRVGSTEEGADPVPIEGIAVEPTRRPGEFEIVWKPAVVLSEKSRSDHRAPRPLDWSRRIADDLITCLWGEEAGGRLETDEALAAARREIWDALMPSQYKSVVKDVPPAVAMELWRLLKDERVRTHQMDLRRNARRVYPAQGGIREDPPLAVLGRWGTLDPDVARESARAELLLPDDRFCSESDIDRLRGLTARRIYQQRPMSGLELLSARLLERPEWRAFERRPEEYTYLANQSPRQPLQRYFQELVPASETPHVITTLDLGLQRQMRLELERVMQEQRPAAALAIALEVSTGKVLAVDAIDPYGMGGFLPTLHTFTPGSTMKVVVMASALEQGVVRPDEKFNTFEGHLRFPGREIHEAEGAQHTGFKTAAQGFAYSINAVLVQIGLRVPAEALRGRFLALGYSQYPGAGLGGERCGAVPRLPWKREYEHASVSFGHEMLVTLWQHAAALCTVVRGGEYRPPSLIEAIEQGGVRHPVSLVAPRRVFSPETCRTVREMMMLGAREGTGRRVYCPDIVMGTKTGTAEKVSAEVCLHVELEHNRLHGCRGARACRAKLAGVRSVHSGGCYTSSMCAWGHMPGDGREVMVLVVVDEPRGNRHYGSEVAGPAAAAILKEALGYTRGGVRSAPLSPEGFVATAKAESGRGSRRLPVSERPWAEVHLAAR